MRKLREIDLCYKKNRPFTRMTLLRLYFSPFDYLQLRENSSIRLFLLDLRNNGFYKINFYRTCRKLNDKWQTHRKLDYSKTKILLFKLVKIRNILWNDHFFLIADLPASFICITKFWQKVKVYSMNFIAYNFEAASLLLQIQVTYFDLLKKHF